MKLFLCAIALISQCVFASTLMAQILFDDFSTNTLGNYTNPSGGRTALVYDSTNQQVTTDGSSSGTHAMAHNSTVGSLNDAGGSLTILLDFLTVSNWNPTAGGNFVSMALGTAPADLLNGGWNGWEVVLRHDDDSPPGGFGSSTPLGLRIRPDGGSTNQILGTGIDPANLSADTWYTMEFKATYTGVDQFDVSARVYAQGGGPDLLTVSGPQTNDVDLTTDLYAALGIRDGNTNDSGVVAADNFKVIPEPSAHVLLLGAFGLGSLLRRRRR